MLDAFYLVLATLFSLLGMVWLALAMDVHWAQSRGIGLAESRPPSGVLRLLGGLALVSSLLMCLAADRPSIAVLVWIMLMVGAAFLVSFVLANRPRVLKLCFPVD